MTEEQKRAALELKMTSKTVYYTDEMDVAWDYYYKGKFIGRVTYLKDDFEEFHVETA